MGCCLGKLPATRDDLRGLRDDLRDEFRIHTHRLETILHRIDGNVRFLCDETICPTGKNLATHSSVLIEHEDGQAGHGLLMIHAEEYLVLTAAHVAVFFVNKEKVNIKCHPWKDSATSITATVKNVFLSPQYVKDGSMDVGLIAIQCDSYTKEELGKGRVHTLFIDEDQSGCGVVVGEGAVGFHLRGERVQMVPDKDSRYIIHAPSKPGISGLPLFQASGKLVGLVHGETKHRGGHTADKLDRPSPFLYADSINYGLQLFCVNEVYAEPLLVAEEMPFDIAGETPLKRKWSDTTEEYRIFAGKLGDAMRMGAAAIDEASVDDMMAELADNCFKRENVKLLDSIRVVTMSDPKMFVDKMSQGHESAIPKPDTPTPVKRQRIQQEAGENSPEV